MLRNSCDMAMPLWIKIWSVYIKQEQAVKTKELSSFHRSVWTLLVDKWVHCGLIYLMRRSNDLMSHLLREIIGLMSPLMRGSNATRMRRSNGLLSPLMRTSNELLPPLMRGSNGLISPLMKGSNGLLSPLMRRSNGILPSLMREKSGLMSLLILCPPPLCRWRISSIHTTKWQRTVSATVFMISPAGGSLNKRWDPICASVILGHSLSPFLSHILSQFCSQ